MDQWVEIEKEYIKDKLLDAQGIVQKNYDLKRKPFLQNDLKLLYGLQLEDMHFLADLVERKEIFVKSSKAIKGDKVARLSSPLVVAHQRGLAFHPIVLPSSPQSSLRPK